MKHIFYLIFILFSLQTFSQIPSGYYNGTAGLEEEPLRMALRSIITSDHHSNSYDDLYGYYESTDNYTNGKVWDMYSIHADGTADYWYDHTSGDHCGEYNSEADCFNREHSVPQSWFGGSSPMYADLFIVIPSDGYVNGQRSNLPYGETSSASWTSTNGSKKGSCSYSGYSGTIFEPIDKFKGDFARAYFYIVTRYNVTTWSGASFNADGLSTWTQNMLLEWNELDPVSDKEIDRNNAVYAIQENRNPYIDHPEFVECVFGGGCNGLNFTSTPVTEANEAINYTYNITYNVEDDTETISCPTKPAWLTFTPNEANNTALISGTPSSSNIGNHSVVLELSEAGNTKTQSFTIVVSEYSQTQDILNVDFSSCPPSGWTTYSVAGNEDWTCNSQTYEINAFDGDVACNDWFVSPGINLNDYENEILTFKSYNQYDDDGIADPEMKLKYSTNYSGTGNPESASWSNLSYTYQTTGTPAFTSSGNINLSTITGTSVYLAFQYTSSGTAAASSTWWAIDDILLEGDLIGALISEINSEIKIFPNPANNLLNINSETEIIQIKLINVLGKECINVDEINNKTYQLNIQSLSKGIYFVEIINNKNNRILKKLIKE